MRIVTNLGLGLDGDTLLAVDAVARVHVARGQCIGVLAALGDEDAGVTVTLDEDLRASLHATATAASTAGTAATTTSAAGASTTATATTAAATTAVTGATTAATATAEA